MRDALIKALTANESAFGTELSDAARERLADYFEILTEHNARLHLVAPCPPEEFATRHVLESLTLLKHLPAGAAFADIGSGGGLPAIPCLLARDDLRARLIESKEKKAEFLRTAASSLQLTDRLEVIAKQFSETEPGETGFVTCRALDKFGERLRRLVKWSGGRPILFFGGEQLGGQLADLGLQTTAELMPLSERRYLFAVSPV